MDSKLGNVVNSVNAVSLGNLTSFLQEPFKAIYNIIAYFMMFIAIVVVLVGFVLIFVNIYNEYNDTSYKTANTNNANFIFSKYKLFDYIHSNYDNSNLSKLYLYIQPYFLNMGAILFIIFLSVIILNFVIMILLNFNGISIGKDFISDNTLSMIGYGTFFIFIMWYLYVALFDSFIFQPLKGAYNNFGHVDEIINKHLIKDELVIDRAMKISPTIALREYVDDIGNITNDEAVKVVFTLSVLNYLIETMEQLDNPDIMDRVKAYLKNPIENENQDLFYGFTTDGKTLSGCITKLDTDTLESVFDKRYNNRETELLKIKSTVQTKLHDVKNYLNNGSKKLDQEIYVSAHIYIMFFISLQLLIGIYIYSGFSSSDSNSGVFSLISNIGDTSSGVGSMITKFFSGTKGVI